MQKFLRLSSLDAFDPLPSLGGRVPTPAKAAPPALAPVAGRPHMWRTPAGALAYLPPPPGTPRKPGALPSAPRMPAPGAMPLSVDKFGALVGQPPGLYLVTHVAPQRPEVTFLRLWDPDREFLSFSLNDRSTDKDSLRAAIQSKLGEVTLNRRTITRVEPYRSAYLTKILKDMGLL